MGDSGFIRFSKAFLIERLRIISAENTDNLKVWIDGILCVMKIKLKKLLSFTI